MVNGVGPWQRVTAVNCCVLVRQWLPCGQRQSGARAETPAIAEAPSLKPTAPITILYQAIRASVRRAHNLHRNALNNDARQA